MNRIVCTIVSNNYLAHASVLAESLARHEPETRFVTLLVDRPDESVDYEALPFELVSLDQLFPSVDGMAFRYTVLEFNTAVKPTLLLHLFEQTDADQIVYLDPDILVLDQLDPVWDALDTASVALTPHILEPLPDDDLIPNERSFLQCGVYNLGFAGFSRTDEALALLRWWQERLEWKCIRDVERGLFVDQKWMDLAPAYVERVAILRDPGLNVAYWNLPQRQVEGSEERWTANGSALRFFHYSGYNPWAPDVLSRHQDRWSFDQSPSVKPLFEDYGRRLLEHRHFDFHRLPYGFSQFEDGEEIPDFVRAYYRRVSEKEDRWQEPFAVGSGTFRDWLDGTGGGTRCPRFALALRESRPDLQRAFPHLPGESEHLLLEWMLEWGRTECSSTCHD